MNAERSQDPSLVEEPGTPVAAHLSPAPEEEPHPRPRPLPARHRFIPKWLSVLLTIVGASGAAILVISTVAAIVVPRFISKTDQAKMAAAKSDEATLVSELDSFRVDCGRYPTAKEGLNALQSAPPSLENKWKGPYATADVPNDPWGHPYVYRITNNGRNVSIESYGSDGQPGGEGSTSETDIVDRVD